jgi:hypothetical protein
MKNYEARTYSADAGRGTGQEKVISVLLTSPGDILAKEDGSVVNALLESGMAKRIGLYFYRFANDKLPFMKIGECTRSDGVLVRFRRGWHGTETYTDSYRRRRRGDGFVDSEFLVQIQRISPSNPAYFIFYEHRTLHCHPKIDELYAYAQHLRLYRTGTLSPEKMNGNTLLGRKLLWHRAAFSEVARKRFPDGTAYPVAAKKPLQSTHEDARA